MRVSGERRSWIMNSARLKILPELEDGQDWHNLPHATPIEQQHSFIVAFWFLGFEHEPKIKQRKTD